MPAVIQFRRDTAANWTSNNPTLASGEMGVETDTNKYKVGDGSTAWTSLTYSSLPSTAISNTTFTTKGDILGTTAASTIARLAVGTDTYVLTADSAASTGLAWASPTTGDITGVTTAANSGMAGGETSGDASISVDANNLSSVTAVSTDYVVIEDVTDNTTKKALVSDITALNSATATALETARNIGGVSFDGTAAIVPGTITVADTTDTTCSVALFESATGDLAPKTDGGATYNAGTGTLTATGFAGPLTGDVTGNASGTAATVTGAAQSAITSVGTLTSLDVTGAVAAGSLVAPLAFNNQTASYTLVLADAGKAVEVNNASANTLTVPPNSSVAFPTGTQIIVFQQGAGATTITAGAGVTLRSKDSNLAVDGQYASVALIKRDTDEWYVIGALA